MNEIDWKIKYENLCKKLMHELTPGGSEFWMDPDRCIEFARMQIINAGEAILDELIRLNQSRLLRWLWNRTKGFERRKKP